MRLATIAVLVAVLAVPVLGAEKKDDKVDDCLKRLKSKEYDVRLAAVADAVDLQDAKITTQLVKLLKDKDPDIRLLTIEGLRSRATDAGKKKAAQVLAARLKPLSAKSTHSDEYEGVIDALHDLARPESIEALMEIDHDETRNISQKRLLAVANSATKKAIDELIKFMSKGGNKGRNNQRGLAGQALQYATGVRLGNDPDKWRAWWKDNRDTFDLKLVVEDREAKKRAAEEREAKKREAQEKKRERKEKKDRAGKKEKKPKRDGPPD